jgi:DMSO/TMAO reductase YedYZ molybdopterin-dependent catalytic subunit
MGAIAGFAPRHGQAADASDVTPADQFFVRDHFPEPDLSIRDWQLGVEGRVSRPLTLTFSDLLESQAVKQASLLECAGNGERGGAVSMGVWEGVPLSRLLERAGADRSGDVILEGADSGRLLPNSPVTPYSRIVPREKAWASDGLVAFKLNGRFLPLHSGFPARVILPGWYGMDSVKWLRRIVVQAPGEKPSGDDESGMSRLYSKIWKHQELVRITAILVKSVINSPGEGARLLAGVQPVSGYAWTGSGTVRRVEISVDGGSIWRDAKLETPLEPFSWVRWSYAWQATSGNHRLLSRAEDSAGNQQPLARDPDRLDSYELNWSSPVQCTVR